MQIKQCLLCEAHARKRRPRLSDAEVAQLSTWVWRGDEKGMERPLRCGKCGSPYWDKPLKRRR